MSFQDISPRDFTGPCPSSSNASDAVGEQLCASLSLEIFKINANAQGIQTLACQIGSPRDSVSLRARLHDLVEVTRVVVFQSSLDIKTLASMSLQGPALNKIISDLNSSLHKFQAAQRLSIERQRTVPLPAPPTPSPESQAAPLVDVSDAPHTHTYSASHDALILDRQVAIAEIEQSVHEVSAMFRELAHLVDTQGRELTVLEWTTGRAARDIECGADELHTAQRHQRHVGRTCLMLILSVVCAAVIVAILV
ncbi:t-SNARE [Mycena sp. CBHHK59/15]|nr:t-SNARE [Mycena sp. CBHHK59/15]